MGLAYRMSGNRTLSLTHLAGSLLLMAAIGCGGDDSGSTKGSTAGSGGGGGADGSAGDGAAVGAGGTAGTGDQKKKQEACQCYIDLGIIPRDDALKAECVSNMSDACMTCTNGVAAGANCGGRAEADFNSCAASCAGLINPPATAQACKDMIKAFGQSPVDVSVTDCLCDNCLASFAPCMVNRGCMSIVLCVGERNCDLLACLTDQVCGPLITNVAAVYPTALTNLMIPVSACNTTYLCRPNPVPDGGTGSAGDAGGAGGADGGGDAGGTGGQGGIDGGG